MLNGKVVWITGASSGLGRELARKASEKGAHVVLMARNKEKLIELKTEIEEKGGKADFFTVDISQIDETTQIASKIIDSVGLDVLINNAGFGVFEKADSLHMDTVREMFSVNVVGLIGLTRAVLPYMLRKNNGHIINIASQAGKLATPKSTVYAATKHAVLGFTNGLRLELNETNIHISSVNPGPIETPFFERADQEGTYVKSVGRWMLHAPYVAERTIKLISKPRRELNLPRWMGIGTTVYQLMPRFVEKIAAKKLNKK